MMSNSSNNKYDKISRFLNGEMEADEKLAFEKELENNESLHDEFMKVVTRVFEKKRIQDNINELRESHPVKVSKAVSFNSIWIKVAAIIIIAIVVGGIILLNTSNKPETLLISENLNYSSPYIFRNGETNEKDLKLTAHWYFMEKDYKQSAELLKDIVEANPVDEESKFYLGLSLLSSKDKDNISKSIQLFNGLLNSKRFGSQSHWFLALALYETGQPDKAKVYFNEIVENEWSYKDRAKELLSELY